MRHRQGFEKGNLKAMQQSIEAYPWWKTGIIYQIYPRSFQDTSQNGTGDLRGIIQRLDYLRELGVEAIWLSPIFPSPLDDFGYDISDYTGIDPLFGDMKDFDELLELTHQRGMKLILDLVPNHTSYQHPWFQESRSLRDNPKRDWYIWQDSREPTDGTAEHLPPNNWQSVFGGSAWEWDEDTQQYYYHAFLKEQPDLNWRNPAVKRAVLEVIQYWLDKGVDGFRVDVIWHLGKDALFRDNPINPDYHEGDPEEQRYLRVYSEDQPIVHDIIADMRALVNRYEDRLLIGEIYLPIDRLVAYYGSENNGVHLPFNFQLIQIEWRADNIYALINEYEGSLSPGNWPNWVLGNHDQPRIVSRTSERQARLAAVLLFTLRGTPIMYYGDEIGMHDVVVPSDRQQDMKNTVSDTNRDPERTPMQWNSDPYAGFSTVEPWLPVSDDYRQRNVAQENDDPASVLSFYKTLITLRQRELALQVGDFVPVGLRQNLMLFERVYLAERVLVMINFGTEEAIYSISDDTRAAVLFSSSGQKVGQPVESSVMVEGEEALILKLNG